MTVVRKSSAGLVSRVVLLGLLLVLGAGCAAGVNHRVRPGENLYRIGKAYGYDYKKLARINGVRYPYLIKVGQKLYIPGATRQLPVTLITPRAVSSARPKSRPPASTKRGVPASTLTFAWPAKGKITAGFGLHDGNHHDGLDIGAPRGGGVAAARDGKVIFSDRLSGYGNVVILEHNKGFTSVYAHNATNLVRKGARIRQGQRIATIGATGRTNSPHLHFEIRKDNVARNPRFYLP